MGNTKYYRSGFLEVYCGPMKSGKSAALISRVEKLNYAKDINFQLFKPKLDNRFSELQIVSRKGDSINATIINEKDPKEILDKINENVDVVAIDEVHFFDKELVNVVKELVSKGKNVIISGLDLDFRGEPFGCMPELLALADRVIKLEGICDFSECNNRGVRSQRIINGKPAHYTSPLIQVGDDELYEVRCLKHHEVPNE
ncbi:thymidine kinase [archaeon]|nr:thymidine kinase [archaeon]